MRCHTGLRLAIPVPLEIKGARNPIERHLRTKFIARVHFDLQGYGTRLVIAARNDGLSGMTPTPNSSPH
jgi:hypothetical protein